MHRWTFLRCFLLVAGFMKDTEILGFVIMSKFTSFPRKISPDHGPGNAGGTGTRVKLQEERASGSLNGKLINQEGKIALDWCKGHQ